MKCFSLILGLGSVLNIYVYGIHDADVLRLYKNTYHGDGTYYGNTPSGLCTLNVPSLPDVATRVDKLVALNNPQMFGSSSCGMCLKVNGSGVGAGNDPITGMFYAYVKDLCPECHAGSVDLADNGDGRWKVSIQAVQCPVYSPIQYTLQGSNDYYIKLQTRNERMPSTTVEMWQPNHHKWATLHRTRDGFWTFPSSAVDKPIVRPFKLRLTAPNGESLIDHVNPPSMGYTGVINGLDSVQYAYDSSLPTAPIPMP